MQSKDGNDGCKQASSNNTDYQSCKIYGMNKIDILTFKGSNGQSAEEDSAQNAYENADDWDDAYDYWEDW